MKCRIKNKNKLNKTQLKVCNQYIQEEQLFQIRRTFKLFCVVLNSQFGFGVIRLNKVISEVARLSEQHQTDDIYWEHIDKLLINNIHMDFDREDYEEILKGWEE